MDYKPPFHITDEMVLLISSISEKLGKISIAGGYDSKPHLRKINRIKSVHSSLKIEANSLSLNQVKDVIDGKFVIGENREIQEVKNAYDAYEKISSVDPYELDDLLKLHGIMTKYLLDESGVFRKGEEGVFDGDKCIFMAPPAKMVSRLMNDLFVWMNASKETVHPLILSSVFHYEFVFIHPFSDGNGRMARLWHTAVLTRWNKIFEYIPLESKIEKFQDEYYAVISKCHSEGNSNPFILFMLKQIDSILNENQLREDDEYLSEYVKKLLGVMEYGTPYTLGSLMDKLNLKSKETFRKNYMYPALKLNLVNMTIPDKPKSKNQRYIKTQN